MRLAREPRHKVPDLSHEAEVAPVAAHRRAPHQPPGTPISRSGQSRWRSSVTLLCVLVLEASEQVECDGGASDDRAIAAPGGKVHELDGRPAIADTDGAAAVVQARGLLLWRGLPGMRAPPFDRLQRSGLRVSGSRATGRSALPANRQLLSWKRRHGLVVADHGLAERLFRSASDDSIHAGDERE